MLQTSRNKFYKPEGTDYIDITYLTANWDAIDVMVAKHNLNAATAPTVNDDSEDDYSIGSLWYDLANNNIYTAFDVTVGAAVWIKIYPVDTSIYATVASLAAYAKLDGSNSFSSALSLTQIATPSAPAAGYTKIYTKSDGLLYRIVNGGSETKVGITDHGDLTGLSDDDHTQYIKHALATAANDFLIASGSGAYVKKTLAETKTLLGLDSPWVAVTDYTTTPASTSTITTTSDLTGTIKTGTPLKYVIGGVTYYGIVTAITSNTITIAGISLSSTITSLYYGKPERVIQADFNIQGTFADAANTALLNSDMNTAFDWNLGKAYCVLIRHKVKTDDSGANQPRVTISINGSVVGTDNTNAGQAVAETWTSTVIGINSSNYDINFDEPIEIVTDANGSNDDALDLTVSCIFVLE